MDRESGSLGRLVNVGKTKCWDFQLEYPVNNRQSLNVSGLATNILRIIGVPVVEHDFFMLYGPNSMTRHSQLRSFCTYVLIGQRIEF